MHAFAKIIAAVFGTAKPDAEAIAALEVARARDAWRQLGIAYRDARRRGDTRTEHAAFRAYRDATHTVLRLEIGARR